MLPWGPPGVQPATQAFPAKGGRMKSGKAARTVDEYLAETPEPARTTLQHIRKVIKSVVPKETTEVISYRIPMFKFNGMLVGYAAFAKHCSLFPTGSGVIEKFRKELKGYATSRGTNASPAPRGTTCIDSSSSVISRWS